MQINNTVFLKLHNLSSSLKRACIELEIIAKQGGDENIALSVRSVAMETKQYIEELNSQQKTLFTWNMPHDINNDDIQSHRIRSKNFISDELAIEECCSTEVYIEKAYRSILNENFPYSGLRNLLTYQLNGIKCAFMKLRLLKSVMHSKGPLNKVLF